MNKLRSNFIYNTLYQLLGIIIPIITAPYIARHIGPHGLGIFSFANANIGYFILLANVGFNMYGQNEIAKVRDNDQRRSQVFWHLMVIKTIFALTAFVIFLILWPVIFTEHTSVYLILSLQILNVGLDISWFYMGLEDFRKTALRNIVVKLIATGSIFIFVNNSQDLLRYCWIIFLSNFIGNLSIWLGIKKYISFTKIKSELLKTVIVSSMILFIPNIATSFYTSLNRTFIGLIDSKTSVAYYVQADTLIKVILTLLTSLGTVMMPHMTNMIAKGHTKKANLLLYKSFGLMSFIALPITIGVVIVAPRFTNWFLGPNFAPVSSLLIIESITLVLIAWSNVLGIQYLVPHNKLKLFSLSVSIPAIINIIITPIFTYYGGVKWAMVATVITELIVLMLQLYYVRKDLILKKLFSGFYKPLISVISMLIMLSILNWYITITSDFLFIISNVILGCVIYLGCSVILKSPYLNLTKILSEKNELEI